MSYIGNAPPGEAGTYRNYSDVFSGNGSTTFTLSYIVVNTTDVEVLVNNVQQNPFDGSYSIVNNNVLTFSEAPSTSTNNVVVYYRAFSKPVAGSAGSFNNASFSSANSTLVVETGAGNIYVPFPGGNSTVSGLLQIIDDTTNTSITVAASANTVKATYELASNAYVQSALLANESYANAVTYANTKASDAYSNATSYADTIAGTAYSNAVSTANTTSFNQAANAYANATSYADTIAGTAYANAVSTANTTSFYQAANAYANATSYADTIAGTAYTNATSYAASIAATAYANAVSTANTAAYVAAATAYSNATSYADTVAATAYSNATSYADTVAATAYSNATSYADTVAATAYSNAVSYANNQAAGAYSNAVSYADTLATTTYTNATNYTDIEVGIAYSNAIAYSANATNITSGTLDTARLPSTISIGNTSVNTVVNSTAIAVRQADFSPVTPATIGSWQEGRVYYDSEEKTIVVQGAGSSNVELTLGQREWVRCRNGTGATIAKGKPVYATGVHIPGDPTHGHHPTVALADASDLAKSRVIGVTAESIADGAHGYVVTRGYIEGLDTSALTEGEVVHLGYASPGDLVTTAPTYPNYPFEIGLCLTSNSTVGTLYVDMLNQTFDQFRVTTAAYIEGSLTVEGDLSITGNITSSSVTNLSVKDNFIYIATGDNISPANTTFTGSGLNDMTFRGVFEGNTTTHYYVKIVSTGTPDTFAWSKDNFSTTEANNVSITGNLQALDNGISIEFNATTGHTANDMWDGVAAPVNVDVGWVANYNDTSYAHTGLFRDASDGRYKFFQGYTPEPDANVNIDTSHVSFQLADVQADTFYGNFVGTVTGSIATADALTNARQILLSGDVAGNTTFDGSSNVTITTTIGTLSTSLTIANTLSAGNTTVNGTLTVTGNTTFDTNTLFVDATNNRVGIKTLIPTAPLTVGEGGATLTTPLIQVTDTQNSYIQVALQNLSNGEIASSDYVLTADNGTDLTNYVDLGIASSAYNYPDFSIIQPIDGYLFNQGGRLLLGTGAGKDIVFFTGGTTTGSEKVYFYSNGVAKFLNQVIVNNSIIATTLTANIDASNIVSGTISNSRLNTANATSAGIVTVLDSVTNTSITIAASANSAKTAYDRAGTAYSNAVSYAATIAGTAYSNAVSTASTDATTKAGTAYSNAVSYAATIAGTAYSNAVSYAATIAGTAYTNATSYAATIAGTAYSNAVAYAASNTYVNSTFAKLASPAFTGTVNVVSMNVSSDINFADSQLTRPLIKDYGLVHNSRGSISGAQTIDLTLGNYVSATVGGAITWTFSNPAPTANACGFVLELTNGGSATQSWPAAVKWPAGTAPTLTASGVDVLVFITDDAGTTWRGMASMIDSK